MSVRSGSPIGRSYYPGTMRLYGAQQPVPGHQQGYGEARIQTEVLEEGLRSVRVQNPGMGRVMRVGEVREGLMEDYTLKNRVGRDFRGRGRSRVLLPYPHQLFCPRLSCDLRRLFINILIVCSWPPLGLMSSLSSLIKEAIVAWSPRGQQWPGSARHFLLPLVRLSPLLETLRPHPHLLSVPTLSPSLCLSVSSLPFPSFPQCQHCQAPVRVPFRGL